MKGKTLGLLPFAPLVLKALEKKPADYKRIRVFDMTNATTVFFIYDDREGWKEIP